ncbi:MAG: serine hydrolase domain-containing protein [Chthoniobacterales bacterium]
MMTRAAFLLVALASSASAALQPVAINLAARYSASRGGTSLLMIENGRTVREEYPGGGPRAARKIYSGTKAFWTLGALAAAEDGLLSLDERVADTIPAWRNDAGKARITIRQLLDFSSGLDPVFRLHNDDPGDRDEIAIRAPIAAEPGRAFIYGPSALQVFHAVLKEKLHGENPQHFLERRVLHRLGLGRQRYLLDRAGNPLLAAGWELTARQWAKLGDVVLQHGAPVISSSSLEQCWRGSSANRAYSLGWWNNHTAPHGREFDFEQMLNAKWRAQDWNAACLCREAPNDLVACIGSLYQRLYVVPSMQLVVVRNGNGRTFSDARFLRLLLGRER